METSMPRIGNVSGTTSDARQGRGRKIGSTVAVLILGVCLGAGIGLALAPSGEGAGFGVRSEPQVLAACDGETVRAECTTSSFVVWEHAMPDRISKMFPTHGI